MTQEPTRFPIPPVDDRPLYELGQGGTITSVLFLSQQIALFEYLAEQPATLGQIAEHYQVVPRAAEAVVAVAAASGYLQRSDSDEFGLTELCQTYLLPSSPFYREIQVHSEKNYERLKGAFYRGDDEDFDNWLAVDLGNKDEDRVREFISGMHRLTLPAAGGLAQQDIFKGIDQLLDVGGGSGSLVAGIADHNPHIRCTLLDLDIVCAIARENIASFGLADRVTTFSADMFDDPWPSGHDALLFGNIFHDWDVESCVRLAQRAYDALEPGGHILVHEMPLDETRDGPLCVACWSVTMLMFERGKQYTLSQLEWILSQVGFSDFRSTPSYGYYHLASAKK
jgi:hypothetical protein